MAIAYSDPDGDIESQTSSTGEFWYTEIDEGVREPDIPDTDDYVSGELHENYDSFTMSDVDLEGGVASSVRIWAYGNITSGDPDWLGDISLNGGSSWTEEKSFEFTASPSWKSVEFAGEFTQEQINALAVKVKISNVGNDPPIFMYAMYAEITYEPYAPPVGYQRTQIMVI